MLEARHHQMSVSDETIEESGWWLAYDDELRGLGEVVSGKVCGKN
jgi:hypothetical protein